MSGRSPYALKLVSSMLGSTNSESGTVNYLHILETISSALHSRNREKSSLQYQIGFILTHGGCKLRDIERLSKMGLCTSPKSIQTKLLSWETFLDAEVLKIKEDWTEDGSIKSQLIGDNWDKNIISS
ncbi:hypothetical protein KP79_PYT18288 [Mizuhopecten yessoensis]|uniref:Uncharacterized protein n=1 Tax=Mizuhopecten yessoensis TaxID=6573 RepID=A0A210QPA9_MIZYE|nr:hypothetical protein KP79_PYT18288 [Mizuhopecten yessoensis]